MFVVLLLLAARAEKCSERSVAKFPVVFAECERWYDECECLQRKLVYLREKQCEEHALFAETTARQAAAHCADRELRPRRATHPQTDVCTSATTSAGSSTAAASTSRRWGSGGT